MEIKPRPDAPGLWEREDGALMSCGKDYWCHVGEATVRSFSDLRPGRYRLRTLPAEPWPVEVKIEKRRLVVTRDSFCHAYIENALSTYPFACKVLDELRDCEVDDAGELIRVLPKLDSE